jgi:hypothetical protein
LIGRILASGLYAAAASAVAAAACSRMENRHAARSLNAIAHIYDGGEPPARDGPRGRNTAVGLALHTGASLWWALFFEALFGRRARRSTRDAVLGGSVISVAAYLVDYHVVSRRFQPGFEAHLSRASMFAVYASLAAGFAAAARLGSHLPSSPRRRGPKLVVVPAKAGTQLRPDQPRLGQR